MNLDGGALARLRRVSVGSTNEPKLAAVRSALAPFAPDVRVEGVAVDSGVPAQPVGFDEIILGARTRASNASDSLSCDLAIGIEDGLVRLPVSARGDGPAAAHWNIGCAAVTDGERTALGFSSAFAYPPACAEPAVRDREPIGTLFDRLWQQHRGLRSQRHSAQSVGNIGRLSEGALPRAEYARHGVLCALVAFLQPDLYPPDGGA